MRTPLDHLDIPAGVMFEVHYVQFARGVDWYTFWTHSRESAREHVAWAMRSANCRAIRIAIEPARGWTRPRVVLDMTRPNNLAPWTCPQMPGWRASPRSEVNHASIA